jgi:hypothetical protein
LRKNRKWQSIFQIKSLRIDYASGLLPASQFAMTKKQTSRRDKIFIEISSQAKAACGAAAVFQVICGSPHVMHKEMWFLPIFYP